MEWYLKAAEQGHADAQSLAGFGYYLGIGIQEDKAKALFWWLKAAAQGDGASQNFIGDLYFSGEVVGKNKIEAYAYWKIAGATIDNAKKISKLEKDLSTEEILAGQRRAVELQKQIAAKMAGK
jgi:TPR repeat protein